MPMYAWFIFACMAAAGGHQMCAPKPESDHRYTSKAECDAAIQAAGQAHVMPPAFLTCRPRKMVNDTIVP